MSPSVQRSTGVTSQPNESPAASTTTCSVLPQASPEVNINDALGLIMQLSAQTNAEQAASGAANVRLNQNEQKIASANREKAIQAAEAAAAKAKQEDDGGGIMGFVTSNIGVNTLIGLATGQFWLVAEDIANHAADKAMGGSDDSTSFLGAAAELGGPLYSAIAMVTEDAVRSKSSCLDSISVKDDDVRTANQIAITLTMAQIAVATTVASCGSAGPAWVAIAGVGVSTATQLAEETGALHEICKSDTGLENGILMGGEITGAVLTVGASVYGLASASSSMAALANGSKVDSLVGDAQDAATVIQASDKIYGGVIAYERADDQHDADIDNVEAKKQEQFVQRYQMLIDQVIDDLKDAQQSAQRSTQVIQGIMQTNNQTALVAVSGGKA